LQACADDSRHESRNPVPLRHLEEFYLKGRTHDIFSILNQLEFPNTVNSARLVLTDCTPEETKQVIGPHIRDYLQHDARFKTKWGVSFFSAPGRISLSIGIAGVGYYGPERVPQVGPPHAWFSMHLTQHTPPDSRSKLYIDILTLLPKERIVYLETDSLEIEEVVVSMPNLESLHLVNVEVSSGFLLPNPEGPNANKKLIPSLRRLYLENVVATNKSWDPLVHYLICQAMDNQSMLICVFGDESHVCLEAVKRIEPLVGEFVYVPDSSYDCPLSGCIDTE
jgi:hypothetical protein